MSATPTLEALLPWIEWRFDRASGPGGQNVNKVASRASLLLDFETCDALKGWQRKRIRERLSTRISADGRLRVVSQQARTQIANRELAEQRLIELLKQAFARQTPRIATKPTRSSQRRRVDEKRKRGDTKRLRQRPPSRE